MLPAAIAQCHAHTCRDTRTLVPPEVFNSLSPTDWRLAIPSYTRTSYIKKILTEDTGPGPAAYFIQRAFFRIHARSGRMTRMAVIALVVLGSGCAGNPTGPESKPSLSPEEVAELDSASPAQLVAEAENTLQQAHVAEFAFYAPATLDRMEKQLREIQELGKKPTPDKSKLLGLTRGFQQTYKSGLSNKSLVQSQLTDVLEQKSVIEKLNAPQLYPRDYKSAIDEVIRLVKNVESGKPDKARSNTPPVMQEMRKLEIRIVKGTVLGRASTLLAEAKDKDAKDKARKSFEEATLAYERALKLIDTNPRDQAQIASLGTQATFLAQRSVRMAEEVTRLQEIKPKELEQVALESEHRLQRIAEAMHLPDVRDQSLNSQSLALAKAAEELLGQIAKQKLAATDAEKMSQELAQFKEQVKKLETERRALQDKLDANAASMATVSPLSTGGADEAARNTEAPSEAGQGIDSAQDRQ